MRAGLLVYCAWLLGIGLGSPCAAEPPRSPDAPAASSRWVEQVDAALVASGVEDAARRAEYEARFADQRRQLPAELRQPAPPRERAAQLLVWMHQRLLTGGYHAECSRLDALLDTGQYNCLNSALVYHWLAEELGLETCVIQAPEHVWIELREPTGAWRIETTTAIKTLADAQRAITAAGNAAASQRQLTPHEAVGLIYFNRGAAYFAAENYAAAATANLRALQHDPDNPAAQANLRAAINNWAVQLHQAHRTPEAAKLLEFCRERIEPTFSGGTTSPALGERGDRG